MKRVLCAILSVGALALAPDAFLSPAGAQVPADCRAIYDRANRTSNPQAQEAALADYKRCLAKSNKK